MPTTPDVTPPDYSTAIGQVRLLIPDTEQLGDTPAYLFSDPQVQAFLTLYSNNVKRAAAQAKLVLATSEALINKVIKTYDFQTDGAKLGAELRAQAAELRAEADRDDMDDASDTFLIANQAVKWDNSWL
jgi:predicted ATPase